MSETKKYRLPVAALLIAAANLLGAFALLLDPSLVQSAGFYASQPTIAAAIEAPFLHQNLLHLLGNLIFIVAVGGSLELAAGSLRFVGVYFACAFAGEAMQWIALRHAGQTLPLVGASGAVAGCAAYYAVRYWRLRIPVAPKLTLSVLSVTGVWAALQLAGAFIHLGDPFSSSSYWSHIGGLAAGGILCLIFRAPDLVQTRLDEAVLDDARLQGPGFLMRAAKERARTSPKDITALRGWQEAAKGLGIPDEEAEAITRLIPIVPADQRPDLLRRLLALGRARSLADTQRLSLADELMPTDQETALRLLESVGEETSSSGQAQALFKVADAVYSTDRPRAERALQRLHQDCPSHPLHTQARARGWIK